MAMAAHWPRGRARRRLTPGSPLRPSSLAEGHGQPRGHAPRARGPYSDVNRTPRRPSQPLQHRGSGNACSPQCAGAKAVNAAVTAGRRRRLKGRPRRVVGWGAATRPSPLPPAALRTPVTRPASSTPPKAVRRNGGAAAGRSQPPAPSLSPPRRQRPQAPLGQSLPCGGLPLPAAAPPWRRGAPTGRMGGLGVRRWRGRE